MLCAKKEMSLMELKDFVSETIRSIIEGVKEAQGNAETSGALVNPGGLTRNTSNVANNSVWDNLNNVYAQPVSFDVAVTVEETAGGKGSIKILGGIVNAEAGGQGGVTSAVANKVQFTVPVMLPSQQTTNPQARLKKRTTTGGVR